MIIEDSKGEIKFAQLMLRMLERYAMWIPRRTIWVIPFFAQKVIIISSKTPKQVYHNLAAEEKLDQWMRRITLIKHEKRNEHKERKIERQEITIKLEKAQTLLSRVVLPTEKPVPTLSPPDRPFSPGSGGTFGKSTARSKFVVAVFCNKSTFLFWSRDRNFHWSTALWHRVPWHSFTSLKR